MLLFDEEESRQEVVESLEKFFHSFTLSVSETLADFDDVLGNAMLLEDRERLLETFFHTAFDQVGWVENFFYSRNVLSHSLRPGKILGKFFPFPSFSTIHPTFRCAMHACGTWPRTKMRKKFRVFRV